MEMLRTCLDLLELLKESEKLSSWNVDDGNIYMAVGQGTGIPEEILALPTMKAAIEEISKLRGYPPRHMMLNRLFPGTMSPVHRDWIKGNPEGIAMFERWHLPIKTNDKATYWHQPMPCAVVMQPGFWHGPIQYWKEHYVANLGNETRVHLIVDLESGKELGRYEP